MRLHGTAQSPQGDFAGAVRHPQPGISIPGFGDGMRAVLAAYLEVVATSR
jgi:hypothetical protein